MEQLIRDFLKKELGYEGDVLIAELLSLINYIPEDVYNDGFKDGYSEGYTNGASA